MLGSSNVVLMNYYSLVVVMVVTLMFMAFIVAEFDIHDKWLVETTRIDIVMVARFSQARLLGHRSSLCRLIGEQSLGCDAELCHSACGALSSTSRRCFRFVGGA